MINFLRTHWKLVTAVTLAILAAIATGLLVAFFPPALTFIAGLSVFGFTPFAAIAGWSITAAAFASAGIAAAAVALTSGFMNLINTITNAINSVIVPKTKNDSEAKSKAKSEAKSEAESDSEAKSKVKSEAESEAKSKAESESEAKSKAKSKAESKAESEADSSDKNLSDSKKELGVSTSRSSEVAHHPSPLGTKPKTQPALENEPEKAAALTM